MDVKINFRIITKNLAADPEIGFVTKSISKPYGRAMAMPPVLELNFVSKDETNIFKKQVGLKIKS